MLTEKSTTYTGYLEREPEESSKDGGSLEDGKKQEREMVLRHKPFGALWTYNILRINSLQSRNYCPHFIDEEPEG